MKKSILEVVHESAKDLHDIGLMDVKTMHTFDAMCLSSVRNLTPNQIKRIRLRERVSQPVFAEYLNASSSTIKKWETGEKHPTGPTLKLLNIVAKKGPGVLVTLIIVLEYDLLEKKSAMPTKLKRVVDV